MNKIKNFIVENKLPIGIATLGIAIVGGLTYWFLKKQNSHINAESKGSEGNRQEKKSKNQPHIQTYDEKFTRIVNQIRGLFDSNGNIIDEQIIKAIIKGQYELQAEQMKALVYKSRKQRRRNIGDGLQYAALVTKYQFDAEQIQDKHLSTILARFNIDKATWKQSTNDWQQKNELGFSDLIREEEEKLMMSYRNENVKPKEFIIIQNIFRFLIKTLQVLDPSIIGADKAADDAARYDLIECYTNDIVYGKFGIEQEDIEYSINLLNQGQKQKIILLSDKVAQIMERFINNKGDDKESDFY